VLYPDGVDRNWNDAGATSISRAFKENVDDVGFLTALVEKIRTTIRSTGSVSS